MYTIFRHVLGTIAHFDCQAGYCMPGRLARRPLPSFECPPLFNYHLGLGRGCSALEFRLDYSWRVVKSTATGCDVVMCAVVPRCVAGLLLCIDSGSTCVYMCLCICQYVQMFICIYVYMCIRSYARVSSWTCPCTYSPFFTYLSYIPSCASPIGGQLHSLGSRLRWNKGHFSTTHVSPTAFSRCLFRPSLSCSFQCHIHFAIVYTPGLVGCLVCTVSFVCSWCTCIRATYTGVCFSWDAYDHASNAVVATCGSRAGDRCCLFQLRVISRRNTLMSTWRQVYWPLHARCQ